MIPDDLALLVLGHLDVGALCTVRLVCRALRETASRCLRSVQLSGYDLYCHPKTNFNKFPALDRVSLTDVWPKDFRVVHGNDSRDIVTHMTLMLPLESGVQKGLRLRLPPCPPLPNLRSLSVDADFDPTRAFPLPLTLHELRFPNAKCNPHPAPLLRLTRLTNLAMSVRWDRDSWSQCEALASLTTLRRLEISCPTHAISALGALTLLTYLGCTCADNEPFDVAPLTLLQNLEHLGIGGYRRIGTEHLSAIEGMTWIHSLALHCPKLCVTTLRSLSQLTALVLPCPKNAHVVEGINLEGLQDLTLRDAFRLSEKELVALRRATGLTSLDFCFNTCYRRGDSGFGSKGAETWRATLSHMRRLQSLALKPGPLGEESLFGTIGSLTTLTLLEWRGGDPTPADVAHCARLTKLRVLSLLPQLPRLETSCDAADEYIVLAELPELRKLELCRERNDALLMEVVAKMNRSRHERGWPFLRFGMTRSRIQAV
jgi:hypothetical protein